MRSRLSSRPPGVCDPPFLEPKEVHLGDTLEPGAGCWPALPLALLSRRAGEPSGDLVVLGYQINHGHRHEAIGPEAVEHVEPGRRSGPDAPGHPAWKQASCGPSASWWCGYSACEVELDLAGRRQPMALSTSLQACSQRRQASAQIRQCSCMSAWLWHSSPQLLHAWAQAWSTARVRLAS